MTPITLAIAKGEAHYVMKGFGLTGAVIRLATVFGPLTVASAKDQFGGIKTKRGIDQRLMLLAFLATVPMEDL